MAFFDELKRGASDAADKVVKKAGEITGIAKTNLNIRSSESKLNSVYQEIGFLFYNAERNGVDYTEEIAAQVLKADGLIVEIDNLKKAYAKARGLSVCRECGNEIDTESAFCSFCGAKQEKECSCDCCCDCEDDCEENGCDCGTDEKKDEE